MNAFKKIMAAVLISSLLVTGVGCAGIVAATALSVGAYAWINGVLSRGYDAPLDECFAASLAALEKNGITATEEYQDAFGGTIEAERANGRRVRVELEPLTPNATEVRVRVGVFGDRAMSETIHNGIYDALAE